MDTIYIDKFFDHRVSKFQGNGMCQNTKKLQIRDIVIVVCSSKIWSKKKLHAYNDCLSSYIFYDSKIYI